MTTAQIADAIVTEIASRFCYFSNPEKARLREIVSSQLEAVEGIKQPALPFADVTSRKHGGNKRSLQAAKEGESRRPTQRRAIWLHIHGKEEYGATVEEISKALNIRYTTVSARCSEMKRDGLIKESGKTRPTETSSDADVLIAC